MTTVECKACGKKFTKPDAQRAASSLRMHQDRTHTKRILSWTQKGFKARKTMVNGGHDLGGGTDVAVMEKDAAGHGRMTGAEADAVSIFLLKNRAQFRTQGEAVHAALDSAGVTGRIKVTGSAATRLFKRAQRERARLEGAASITRTYKSSEEQRAYQRAYRLRHLDDQRARDREGKRRKREQSKGQVTGSATINFCPQCGCNIHKVATGMVMADQM